MTVPEAGIEALAFGGEVGIAPLLPNWHWDIVLCIYFVCRTISLYFAYLLASAHTNRGYGMHLGFR